ncbi:MULTISPECIES: Ig-like domain-containing protein [unclassified Spirosoma]|uniref:Ig-like domain-containing protein n=1 Tax=unclassified Spirosoma TaxID=2621999 RepID=UPI000AB41388|nr:MULTISPECIES: Ig-like domain-containing protein [unclassified Spirosoma]MBN8822973.1 hypothetical protein [Spirosoma sp.]
MERNKLFPLPTYSGMSSKAIASALLNLLIMWTIGYAEASTTRLIQVPTSTDSLALTLTSCAQNFSVLSSFSAVGSGQIDPTTLTIVNQPTTGKASINVDGTLRFQRTTVASGTATFTITAASTLTDTTTQRFLTTTGLTVSSNLACEPIPLATFCPIVNRNNITSTSLTDFAHLEQTVLLGETTLKASLSGTGKPGDLAGFVISNPTLTSTTAFPTYTINTYLSTDPTPTIRDTKTFANLSDIQLLSNGLQELSFPATQAFDQLELIITSTDSQLLSNDIYYGFSKPATTTLQKVVTIHFNADCSCAGSGCLPLQVTVIRYR